MKRDLLVHCSSMETREQERHLLSRPFCQSCKVHSSLPFVDLFFLSLFFFHSFIQFLLFCNEATPTGPVFSFVDCVESYNPTLLFSHTLTQLNHALLEAADTDADHEKEKGYFRCDKMSDFVEALKDIADRAQRQLVLVRERASLLIQVPLASLRKQQGCLSVNLEF